MDEKRKLELLADMFEVETDALSPDAVLADMDDWNSMMKLTLIVLIDDECGKTLSGEQIKKFVTVRDIMDFME